MPFLGKQPTAGFASIVKDDLTGNGTTGPYTLSKQVANANDIAVFVGNVRQEPTDAYTVNGNQLTMTGTVASTDDFYILYQGKAVGTTTIEGGGGMFKGENGTVNGEAKGDIFRVHEQTLNTDTTIAATENALASGPLTISATLTVNGNLTVV